MVLVRGDRNCFFRSVSKAANHGNDKGHVRLQRATCQWMVANQPLVEAYQTTEQRAKEPVLQRAVQMSQWGHYAEEIEVMELAYLTRNYFLVYDVVEDTLFSLGQQREVGRKPIILKREQNRVVSKTDTEEDAASCTDPRLAPHAVPRLPAHCPLQPLQPLQQRPFS